MKFRTTAAAALLTLAFAAQNASADVYVETTGTDSGSCGALITPCATIAQATTNAAATDIVRIGNGTFTQTATINPGAKNISYVGNGPASTTISGGNSNAFPANGLIRFGSNGTTVAVRDLAITGFPKTAAGSSRFGIWVQPTVTSTSATINATIDNVQFVGNTGSPLVSENAVYAANNAGSVTISDSDLNDVMGNSILLENQIGAFSLTGSTIDKPLSSTSAVIFDMVHAIGATAWNQVGLHTFSANTINAASMITVTGGWNFGLSPGPSAMPIGVTINGNTINTGTATGAAIGLVNAANTNDGVAGQIDNLSVTGNTIASGTGPGTGIALQGGIPDAEITGNNLRNRSTAISLTRRTQTFSPFTTWDHKPDGADINANQIVDNTDGIATDSGVAITADASENWWGCNEGPAVATTTTPGDCDSVRTFSPPTVTVAPWIVLGLSATPSGSLGTNAIAAISGGFTQDSLGGSAPNAFADGTVLPMTATGGTLTTASPTLTSAVATNAFTSTGPAGRSVTAAFDHESVSVSWPDNDVTPPVVTITAPANGTITSAASVTLNYTVIDSSPTTCSIVDGANVPLSPGANSIVVVCTDAAGNTGYDSVAVIRDNTPPVVTIVSPVDGAQTGAASIAVNYTVVDDYGIASCTLVDGASVPLATGANTISVSCTDNAGNVGSDSVTVLRDTTPPVITITSPTGGALVPAASTTLTYTVSEPATCSPPSGASVPLSVGANTLFVTCTDAYGNVATSTVTVFRPDTLPECARDVVILDVRRAGPKSVVSGIARLSYAGRHISLRYEATGKRIVARPVIRGDGTWSATVARPGTPSWTSNAARYQAVVGDATTARVKLSRRMGSTNVISRGDGRLSVEGRVTLPIAKGQSLKVERSDACGRYRQVGTLRVSGSGTFKGTVADGGDSAAAVFIRLKVLVAKSSDRRSTFNTYSIVQPVIIKP